MTDKQFIWRTIKVVLFFSLCIAAFIFCFSLSTLIKQKTPQAVLLQSEYDLGITVAQGDKMSGVMCEAETDAIISAPYRQGISVRAICAGSMVFGNLQPVWGGFYTRDAVLFEKPYAVISENLFAQLFTGFGANEYLVTINGQDYAVCGVYRSDSDILTRLSSDNTEAVYISRPIAPTQSVTRILLFGEGSMLRIIDNFYENLGNRIYAMQADLRSAPELSRNFIAIAIALCACCVLYYALKKAYRLFMYCFDNSQSLYPVQMFIRLTCGFAIIGAVCIALYFILSLIKLPPSILPSELVFDATHYMNLIIEFYKSLHTGKFYGPIYFSSYALTAIAVICVFAVILFISGALSLKNIFKDIKHRNSQN